ncbi:MAG: zinc-dependent metalloprotease, partial [Oscillospiraceae bacterium]|nr:zinc-dependent metalloprotease [Oscillospiraceae bacterium]
IKLLQQFIANKITSFPVASVKLKPNTIFPTVEITNPDPIPTEPDTEPPTEPNTEPTQEITLADMPEAYQESAKWIWENRCVYEGSTSRRNTIFDQIYAGNGTINFVVRWQSYKTITYEQRQQFEKLASDSINAWNDWLKNYDGWKYDHIDVKIVGWAVLDKNCLLDLHDDEIVYDNLISAYDSQYDTSNGIETIPDKLPSAPDELSRFEHFADSNYQYPNGLENRFDMYLWATQGFPAIGGAGGDWGQRLSDDAYINMLDGTNVHVLEHEIGHGFGITDFYGENGTNAGPPPNGFPDDGTSIMMAGSSTKITNFDGWLLRYMWSQIKDEDGRFS